MDVSDERLAQALKKADAAGDTVAAGKLAAAIRQRRGTAQPQVQAQTKPGFLESVAKGAEREIPHGGLIGAAAGGLTSAVGYGMNQASEAMGSLARQGAAALGAGPTTQKVSKFVGGAIPDIMVGGGLGRSAGAAVSRSSAESLMRSALKPTLEAARTGKAARAIQTMLDEGVNVSKSGANKLRGLIDDLNTEIQSKIASSTATISKYRVASYLNDLTQRLKNQVNPQSDIKAVREAFYRFMNHPDIPMTGIPVKQAQKIKSGTYRALGERAYGEEKAASTEAQKQLARGLREEIGKAVPDVVPLNARERELLNALNITERRLFVELNKNPAGLSLLAKNPVAAGGFLADRSAAFKSLLARVINRSGPALGATAGGGAGAAVSATQKP